jgi:hypothetical protein
LRRVVLTAAIAIALLLAIFGWTARVRPPTSVSSPISVFVVRDELHRGLLLPSPAGGFVEFGFGDWEWYARAQEQWHRVFATVLWPTRGTLARRDHFANDATSLRASMPWATFDEFVVEAGDAVRVRARLDAQFAAGNRERVIRSGLRMHFVPWDRDYWFADTCADAVVEWLQELGCRSSWVPLCFDVAIETSNQGP